MQKRDGKKTKCDCNSSHWLRDLMDDRTVAQKTAGRSTSEVQSKHKHSPLETQWHNVFKKKQSSRWNVTIKWELVIFYFLFFLKPWRNTTSTQTRKATKAVMLKIPSKKCLQGWIKVLAFAAWRFESYMSSFFFLIIHDERHVEKHFDNIWTEYRDVQRCPAACFGALLASHRMRL